VRIHVFVQRGEQQREEDDRLVEVVEKDVVDRKARKRVQQRSEQRRARAARVAVKVYVARQRRRGEFQHEERAHEKLQPLAGERDREPEKWAAEQVKRIRADEVRAEVGQVAPADIARAHRVVRQPVKRHLLHVEVAVKEEAPAVHQHERQKNHEGER